MIDDMIKLSDLYKKYPFIYEVEGECYYIGWGICKLCVSSTALDYYTSYKKILKEIGEDKVISASDDIDDEQLNILLEYFQEVKKYGDEAVDYEDLQSFRRDIDIFVDSLSDEQEKSLLKQLQVFVNVFQRYYRSM